MAKVKIIATLGPATSTRETLIQLIRAGADVFRINMSHGQYDAVTELIKNARLAAQECNAYIPVYMDLRGPKVRVGVVDGEVTLRDGQEFIITTETSVIGSTSSVSTDYSAITDDVTPGSTILLCDGLIILSVTRVEGNKAFCTVISGGVLSSHKGLALPGIRIKIPVLTEKDRRDAVFGISRGVDGFMLSFVQHAQDIKDLQQLMRENGVLLPVMAKIEALAAMDNLDEIAEIADSMMVARGDLGIEMPLWKLPMAQRKIIAVAHSHRKPVIVATEMLQSMMDNSRPTRAEVTDVALATYEGTDLTMLSGETAAGKFPVKSVEYMRKIIDEMEHAETAHFRPVCKDGIQLLPESIAWSAVSLASSLKASAILIYTETGFTARIVSYIYPDVPVYAFTPTEEIARRVNIYRGVTPFVMPQRPQSFNQFAEKAVQSLSLSGFLKPGNITVVTNVSTVLAPNKRTNIIKVITV